MQNEMGLLFMYLLVIIIMLGGMAMMVGGPSLTGRLYGWLFSHLVLHPLRWGLRQGGRGLRWLLQWSGRLLWRLILFLGRQLGRGVRYTWVRLTT